MRIYGRYKRRKAECKEEKYNFKRRNTGNFRRVTHFDFIIAFKITNALKRVE